MIDETAEKGIASPEKANALAYNIFVLSTLFWVLCCFFWLLMAYFVGSKTISSHKGGAQYAKLNQREEEGVGNTGAIVSQVPIGKVIELLQVA